MLYGEIITVGSEKHEIHISSLYDQKVEFLNVKPSTYLLTPWSTVLLEKLTGFQLIKKFPAFYGT